MCLLVFCKLHPANPLYQSQIQYDFAHINQVMQYCRFIYSKRRKYDYLTFDQLIPACCHFCTKCLQIITFSSTNKNYKLLFYFCGEQYLKKSLFSYCKFSERNYRFFFLHDPMRKYFQVILFFMPSLFAGQRTYTLEKVKKSSVF